AAAEGGHLAAAEQRGTGAGVAGTAGMSTVWGGSSPARSFPPSPPHTPQSDARTTPPAREGDEGGGGGSAPRPAAFVPQPTEGAPPDGGATAAPAGAGAGSEAAGAEPATAPSAVAEGAGAEAAGVAGEDRDELDELSRLFGADNMGDSGEFPESPSEAGSAAPPISPSQARPPPPRLGSHRLAAWGSSAPRLAQLLSPARRLQLLYAPRLASARAECLRASSLPGAMDVTALRRKADQGDAEAQHILGGHHYRGQDVPLDYAEAARLYRRAADQGHLGAQFELGLLYRDGTGDDDDAARLYRRAAEQGNPIAQYCLGNCYAAGKGVLQDDREAARLFGLAAEQGYAQARGVPQDDAKAARFYRLAAEQGYAQAQHNLAMLCEEGRGVVQDLSEAVHLFRLAAELLLETAATGSALPAAPGEAARFLAQTAQQTGDEECRLDALTVLSAYVHEPDVVKACCVGCDKTRKLSTCSRCLTAKFCGAECVRRMCPVHKQSCKTFAAAREEAAAAADEHGAASTNAA
ncbi:hypothetical protein T492DRAFT_877329, partial [Pavlovales sp. CCMP2436]